MKLIPQWQSTVPFLYFMHIRKMFDCINFYCNYEIFSYRSKNTIGAFWHNAAETWVDINNSKDGNVMSSIVNLVSGNKGENSVDVHFMSESGVIDLFVLMGPTPKDAVVQYASLTGVAPLPQVIKALISDSFIKIEGKFVLKMLIIYSISHWRTINAAGIITTKTMLRQSYKISTNMIYL